MRFSFTLCIYIYIYSYKRPRPRSYPPKITTVFHYINLTRVIFHSYIYVIYPIPTIFH